MHDYVKLSTDAISKAGYFLPAVAAAVSKIKVIEKASPRYYAVDRYNNELYIFSRDRDVTGAVTEHIGDYCFETLSRDKKNAWKSMLTPADPAHINNFMAALLSAATYRESIEAPSNPVERLTYIHLINALVKNGFSITSAKGRDVRTLECTKSYAKGERCHSLVPLVSAYTPSKIWKSFGASFAQAVENGMEACCHTAVRQKYCDIIKSILAE